MGKSSTTSTATHIRRPPNKWILFRKDFFARGGTPADAPKVWNALTEKEKAPWTLLAARLANEHARRYPDFQYRPKKEKDTSDESCLHHEPTFTEHNLPLNGTRERGRTGHTSASAPYARPPTRPRAITPSSSSPLPSPYIQNLSVGPHRPLPSSSSSAELNWMHYGAQSQTPSGSFANACRYYPDFKYRPKKEKDTSDESLLHHEPTFKEHSLPLNGTRERGRTGRTSASAPYARPPTRPRAITPPSSSSLPSPYVQDLSVDQQHPLPSSSSSAELNWMHYGAQTQTPSGSLANYGSAGHSQMSGTYSNAGFNLVSGSFDTSTNTYNPFSDFDYSSSGHTQLNGEPHYPMGEQSLYYPCLDNGYPPSQRDLGYGSQPSSSYGGVSNDPYALNATFTNHASFPDASSSYDGTFYPHAGLNITTNPSSLPDTSRFD
ncbi:hypothetical protein CYLTODRAFT_409101 [Cylindrobasidium torrendii FP15055 ss-10]|uniref:HMG box domain-containing protein n=1 Tax=Cylindrobasidium torrendii FP15055 ss-10 TaxID=1314674 RepID=A0A0D7BKQ0_9AGAR|nr:hypothetical protein CYLTODRAFT_409101 [Cylindrobasidium torrendii FP15055 ss-10]